MSLSYNPKYITVTLVGGPYHGNRHVVHEDALETSFPRYDPQKPTGKHPKEVNSRWLYRNGHDGNFYFEAEEVG